MTSYTEKFQRLLRELFQFDCADLDFGIYRIMNYKRDVIEQFITEDLPKDIADELDRGALADQSQSAKELKEVAQQIKDTLGKDALDADGNLAEAYHGTPLGKKYQDLKAKAAGGRGREALEASIFNHLYTFFSRYYQDGDFISKRRYSRRQRYAIPYNGEEVYLYWANNDQYYVKTAEYFHDYTFTSRGVTVHFKLQAADIEQNNVKGDKRFFLPHIKEVEWKEDAGELVIPFEYRPLTEQEEITFGQKNQQDTIIAEALVEIPGRLNKSTKVLAALTAEHRRTAEGQPVTFLEHHLRQYTRRNTSDFFIHKDLKGFLSRELDFYLKNEVLNLDEMESAGEERAEGWFQLMRLIKGVGGRIIDFLAQIENFQKMLWEKRKFITETQYCITIGNIDESFYPDVAACEPQWAEWKELFHIDEEQTDLFNAGKNKKDKRIAFLKAHPTLVLDTKHFEQDFVDRLLGSFEDLDKMVDGLLIHSENFQAINLLVEKYREKVECVYIDPPYNTGNDEFIYKDGYLHSSWYSMIDQSLSVTAHLMHKSAIFSATIDDNEVSGLLGLLKKQFGEDCLAACAPWRSEPSGGKEKTGLRTGHEYLAIFHNGDPTSISADERSTGQLNLTDKWGPYRKGRELRKWGGTSLRQDRPGQFYALPTPKGEEAWPIRNDGREGHWRWGKNNPNIQKAMKDPVFFHWELTSFDPGVTYHGQTERWTPYEKIRDEKKSIGWSTWLDSFGINADATRTLKALFGYKAFDTPKPLQLIEWFLKLHSDDDGICLDPFAGSGVTGHAVISANRESCCNRRFILVEMGSYFDTVILPYIKKVTFAPVWKDGKPERMAKEEDIEYSPRIVKYIRLESYEDSLNNIEFDEASGQQALKFDDYLLKYMLKWEARASKTLLNVVKLARPFSYKLHIHSDGQTREKVADIPETFNYLLGLHVQTRRVYDDDGPACAEASAGRRRYLVYRGMIDHRNVAVIWRETEGWQKADLERDKKFVAEQKLTEGADEVFVNGDSFIPGARALEPVFKARMFAEVQA
ncbi:MAG: DNA methyltransferase [Proteobacteria bacterium]|nr:DNA methyltransferase [Pseudomonadota bacterium]